MMACRLTIGYIELLVVLYYYRSGIVLLGRTCNRCIGLTKEAKSLDLSVAIGVHHLAALTSVFLKTDALRMMLRMVS